MKYSITFLFLFALVSQCFSQSFSQVESVEYDEDNNRWLASNGNSILSLTTDGIPEFFGENAKANYGMEIMNGLLFAIHSNSLEIYDLETGLLINDLPFASAGFLNGMASDGEDTIWMSDFGNGEIYEVDVTDPENPEFEILPLTEDIGTPNGLWFSADEGLLYVAQWGSNASILAIDVSSLNVEVATSTSLSNIDGLVRDEEGDFYVSSWGPNRITRFSPDFAESEIITVPGISNPADIGIGTEIDTLAIPNTGTNEILFVGINPSVTIDEDLKMPSLFQIYPNPASKNSMVLLDLETSEPIDLTICDLNGRVVKTLLSGNQPVEIQKVLLAGLNMKSGEYILTMTDSKGNSSSQIFIWK